MDPKCLTWLGVNQDLREVSLCDFVCPAEPASATASAVMCKMRGNESDTVVKSR